MDTKKQELNERLNELEKFQEDQEKLLKVSLFIYPNNKRLTLKLRKYF